LPLQRRKLEALYLDAFKYRMSIASTAERYLDHTLNFTRGAEPLLGQPAGIAVRCDLPSQLSCPKGKWLQQALDLLMVLRAVTKAYELWRGNSAQQEPRWVPLLLVMHSRCMLAVRWL
jgi:hypothetical protein